MLASKFAEYSMLDIREYRIRDWDLNLLFEDICILLLHDCFTFSQNAPFCCYKDGEIRKYGVL
jgi:hypothetical protein